MAVSLVFSQRNVNEYGFVAGNLKTSQRRAAIFMTHEQPRLDPLIIMLPIKAQIRTKKSNIQLISTPVLCDLQNPRN